MRGGRRGDEEENEVEGTCGYRGGGVRIEWEARGVEDGMRKQ